MFAAFVRRGATAPRAPSIVPRPALLALALLGVVPGPAALSAQAPAGPLRPDFGWLADGRRFLVGDIITVVVDEFTAASADRSTSAIEDRRTDAGAGGRLNTSGGDLVVGTFLGNESLQRGRDYRQDRLNSEVSVRVTDVEPNGALRVEGRKMLTIDEHEQEVMVRGVIRPQDITSDNTVESWRVAEVEVMYTTDGSLAKADKGILGRLLGWIIP